MVSRSKDHRFCSTIDCEQILTKPKCFCKTKVTCVKCLKATCFRCGEPWHAGGRAACSKGSEVQYRAYAAHKLITKCPVCESPVIKDAGCNHLSCICGAHFCWICREHFPNASMVYQHWSEEPRLSWTLGCSRLKGDSSTG